MYVPGLALQRVSVCTCDGVGGRLSSLLHSSRVHGSGTHYMTENQKQLKIHGVKRQISLPETLETWPIGR